MAHGTWHMAHGTWHMAHGTWHMAHADGTYFNFQNENIRYIPVFCFCKNYCLGFCFGSIWKMYIHSISISKMWFTFKADSCNLNVPIIIHRNRVKRIIISLSWGCGGVCTSQFIAGTGNRFTDFSEILHKIIEKKFQQSPIF